MLNDFHFACRAETFKQLGGFDEQLEKDFFWKAYFAKMFMIFSPELAVFRQRDKKPTVWEDFFYWSGEGAMMAKLLVQGRRMEPFCEMVGMALIFFRRMLKSVLTFCPKGIFRAIVALFGYFWGIVFFGVKIIRDK